MTVERSSSGGPGDVTFAVTDTGIGIPAGQLDSIFDDFVQADSSATRRAGGTGLGLGISRRLVNMMGGQLTVSSSEGTGSTSAFTAGFGVGQARREPQEIGDLLGSRVLVLDDNATNRLVLREALTSWGIESDAFQDPEEALLHLEGAVAEGRAYALALVDAQMPGTNGFDAARRMHAIVPGIKIVMLASDTERGDVERRAQAGINGFAVKPISRPDLLRVICETLKTSIAPGAVASASASSAATMTRPLSILVAEDFPDNRILVEAYLKASPHTVTYVEDGERAVEAFSRGRFDLVLMDVQMPVMDGLSATRAIRNLERADSRPPVRIIALTARPP